MIRGGLFVLSSRAKGRILAFGAQLPVALLNWALRLSTLISSPMITQVASNSDFEEKSMSHGTILENLRGTFPFLCSFVCVLKHIYVPARSLLSIGCFTAALSWRVPL